MTSQAAFPDPSSLASNITVFPGFSLCLVAQFFAGACKVWQFEGLPFIGISRSFACLSWNVPRLMCGVRQSSSRRCTGNAFALVTG